MLQVDTINTSSLTSPTGPAILLRKYQEEKSYFKSRGYDLNIITPDYFSEKNTSPKINNPSPKKLKIQLKHSISKSKFFSILFTIRTILVSRKLVYKYKKLKRSPDIVIFDEYFVYDQYLRLINGSSKRILFFHSDGLKFEMLYVKYPKLRNTMFAKYLEKRFDYSVKKLDKIAFIAKIGQKNFLKTNPYIEFSKTAFFHNGIEDLSREQKNEIVEIPKHKDYKYRLICTGTVSERKGQYIIINALAKLSKEIIKDIHLTLLGSGSQLPYLQELVAKYSLDTHVTFEGIITNDKVYRYLKQANIYILMSKNEGLPISIIEAMRSGLPIVSTNIAGIPELVRNNFNGVLLDPDESQLINLLNRIKQYNWEEMGENSRSRFDNEFTFEKMKYAYCDMLDTLTVNK